MANSPNTYSFLSINGTLVGPGGSAILGASAGVAEEGITVEPTEDRNTMTMGADGEVMHALHAARPGRAVIRLLKTSPMNAVLSAMYNFQAGDPANWGNNVLGFADIYRGDAITLTTAAFKKPPSVVYDKPGKFNEWEFEGKIMIILGAGVPNVNG